MPSLEHKERMQAHLGKSGDVKPTGILEVPNRIDDRVIEHIDGASLAAFNNGATAMKVQIAAWLESEGFDATALAVLRMDLPEPRT